MRLLGRRMVGGSGAGDKTKENGEERQNPKNSFGFHEVRKRTLGAPIRIVKAREQWVVTQSLPSSERRLPGASMRWRTTADRPGPQYLGSAGVHANAKRWSQVKTAAGGDRPRSDDLSAAAVPMPSSEPHELLVVLVEVWRARAAELFLLRFKPAMPNVRA